MLFNVLMFWFDQCQRFCNMATGYHKFNQVVIPIAEMILDVVRNKYKISGNWYLYFNTEIYFFLNLYFNK